MQQFIYFLTNPGNESFIKAEILKKYPGKLNFSYSKPGIVTYKVMQTGLTPADLRPIYARAWGESIGVISKTEVDNTLSTFQDYSVIELPLNPEDFDTKGKVEESKAILKIQVDVDKTFLGKFYRDSFNSPAGRLFYNINVTDAPSRAYHKTKEAFLLLGINESPLTCIEFGCAPGGGTKFLLDSGHIVYGVDPAEMNADVLAHEHFHFYKKPIQDIRRKDFPEKVDVLLSDVNLNPDVVLKQCHGIFKSNPPKLALITLKTPKPKYLDSLAKWKDFLFQMGYKNIDLVQLASHRKECLAIART